LCTAKLLITIIQRITAHCQQTYSVTEQQYSICNNVTAKQWLAEDYRYGGGGRSWQRGKRLITTSEAEVQSPLKAYLSFKIIHETVLLV
jgi:hypothetical protein